MDASIDPGTSIAITGILTFIKGGILQEKANFKWLGCAGRVIGPAQCHSAARGATDRGGILVSGSLNVKRYGAMWCVGLE